MDNQKLENYLVRLERSLGPISVSEKAEIITEIKSHVLEALSRDETKSTDSILASLGEPEQVASRYLIERGLEPKKPPKHPIVKWIVLGFLGTVGLILITFLIVLWKFTPIVKVSNGEVKLLGGMVEVEKHGQGTNDDSAGMSGKAPFLKNFDASKIKMLEITAGSQDVLISGTKDKTASVKVTYKSGYNETKCYYTAEIKGDTFNIKFEKNAIWSHFGGCGADIEVKVPESTLVKAMLGSGDLKVNNIISEIKTQTGSGNISIDANPTKIDGRTGSGDIELALKPGKTKITADLQTGSGTMTVKMPKDAKVSVTHMHGSGSTHNEFSNSENPNIVINAHSGSGDFYAKKL